MRTIAPNIHIDTPGCGNEEIVPIPHDLAELRQIGLTDAEIVVLSRIHEGYSRREVAELSGLSPNTVARYAKRARQKLVAKGYHFPVPPPGRRLKVTLVPGNQLDRMFSSDRIHRGR